MKCLAILAAALLCGFPAAAAGSDGTILTGAGWTIEARGDGGRITIRHERLGTILSGVRLNLEADGALRELKRWTVESRGPQAHPSSSSASKPKEWTPESGIPGRLLVKTVEPPSTWIFEPAQDGLRISSTAPGAVLTGHTPVSKARGLARLLDSDGAPVTWRGTGECAGTYGGGLTQNPSFLPGENPECIGVSQLVRSENRHRHTVHAADPFFGSGRGRGAT
jgi:hypothetical protein